jgi:single-stranded DNA-binding protein
LVPPTIRLAGEPALFHIINSVTVIGFVGADPEQRQARNNNGSKFTVLSVATQRSWKNTDDKWASKTEWHRVCVIWN